ncbi:9680_t:CDS:1 [Ambispora gerdemannii]|uniref:9680_t:CDS:1 n=1 Tax=Ambispora gerdemannii TaxID=144530 RepID=A0A9N9GTN7_9GLOM|nr:9680_t:CDS:1 [Ambispora gerdemannii]
MASKIPSLLFFSFYLLTILAVTNYAIANQIVSENNAIFEHQPKNPMQQKDEISSILYSFLDEYPNMSNNDGATSIEPSTSAFPVRRRFYGIPRYTTRRYFTYRGFIPFRNYVHRRYLLYGRAGIYPIWISPYNYCRFNPFYLTNFCHFYFGNF